MGAPTLPSTLARTTRFIDNTTREASPEQGSRLLELRPHLDTSSSSSSLPASTALRYRSLWPHRLLLHRRLEEGGSEA